MSLEVKSRFKKIRSMLDDDNIDGVKGEFEEIKDQDLSKSEDKIVQLFEIEFHLLKNEISEAVQKIEPLIKKVEDLPDILKLQVFAIHAKVMAHNNNFELSLASINKFRKITEHEVDGDVEKIWYLTSDVDNLEGLVELAKTNYQTALKRFEAAIQNLRAQKRMLPLGKSLMFRGQTFHLIGNQKESLNVLNKSVEIFEGVENYHCLNLAYDALIHIFQSVNDQSNLELLMEKKVEIQNKLNLKTEVNELFQIFSNKPKSDNEEFKSVEDLEKLISEKDEEIKGLKEKISEFENKLSEGGNNSTNVDELKSKIEKLEKDNSEGYEAFKKLETEISEKNDMIVSLEQEIETLKSKSETDATSSKKDEDSSELNRKIDELKSKVEDLKEEIYSKSNEISDLKDKISSLETESKDAAPAEDQGKLKEMEAKVSELQSTISGKDKQIKERDEKISSLNKQISDLQSQSNEVGSDTSKDLDGEISKLKAELEEVKSQLSEKDEQISKLNDEIKSFETDYEVLESQNNQIIEANAEVNTKLSTEMTKNEELMSEINRLKSEIQNMKSSPISSKAKETKTDAKTETPSVEDTDIMELIGSDQLMALVYGRMQNLKQAKIKVIAFQLGVNKESCEDAIENLVEHGVLAYDKKDRGSVVLIE